VVGWPCFFGAMARQHIMQGNMYKAKALWQGRKNRRRERVQGPTISCRYTHSELKTHLLLSTSLKFIQQLRVP
jgi:hypothetical protein